MTQHFDIDLHLQGELTARTLEHDVATRAGGERREAPLAIAGTLRDARTRRPVPGLRVVASRVAMHRENDAQANGRPADRLTPIAETLAGVDGGFMIADDGGEGWRDVRDAIAQGAVPVVLRAMRGETTLASSVVLPLGSEGLVVELSVAREETPLERSAWMRVAAPLAQARIGTLPALVRTLSAPGDGPFAAWSDEMRMAALEQIEREFLDPSGMLRERFDAPPNFAALAAPGALEAYVAAAMHREPDARMRGLLAEYVGKARSFHQLDEVDWAIDANALQRGDLAGALLKFSDAYRFHSGIFDLLTTFPFEVSDLTRYRDYLREIWVAVAGLYEPLQGQRLTPAQALDQLTTRFHQDFVQTSVASQPANELCIALLKDILLAGTGETWGFGVAASAIPARGTLMAREYLDKLIALSGVSADELTLRYRVDFARPDRETSSLVEENIRTLQAFFRDGFQARPDAFGTAPNLHGQPIVPPPAQGRAPFFLWYDEWQRQQATFHPENHFDYRRAFPAVFNDDSLKLAQTFLAGAKKPAEKADWQLILDVAQAALALQAAHAHYYNRQYALAEGKLDEAQASLWRAIGSAPAKAYDIKAALLDRKTWKVTKMSELDGTPPAYGSNFTLEFKYSLNGVSYATREATRDRCAIRAYYWMLYVVPLARGDIALARGDYARAAFFHGQVTRFRIGVARESDDGGYRPHYLSSSEHRQLYHIGNRPYTADTGTTPPPSYPLEGDDGSYYDTTTYSPPEQLRAELLPGFFHPIEIRTARLRQAHTLLEWADALYRTNEAASVQRARELYKAVLFLHGAQPPISASGPHAGFDIDGLLLGMVPFYLQHHENPAVSSQKARARAGMYKIDHALNWYGERDDVVPALRYRELKDVADRFAALAKATQQDFLAYTGKLEAAMVDRMRLSNLIQKGDIQIRIADEQRHIAEHGVKIAQAQVADVEDAIQRKQKEIEDSQGFFHQLGDFFSGMVGVFKGMPSEATGFIASGAKSTFASGAGAGAMAGLGVLGGYAAFVYAGYTSLSAMADQYSSLRGQLRALEDKALPAAQDQVVARQREVAIADYQRSLVAADIALARDLLTFEERRYLSQEFWSELARLMVRLLRRYLELAARTAWLAERALAYELDREIGVVRFDYFPESLQGVTGADLMQADLAELEAIRVESAARTAPMRVTLSLAAECPLAFGQLKATGRCGFATTERWLRAQFPGTFGYRLRAVGASIVQEGVVAPVRGVLVNDGVSVLAPDTSGARGLVRPAEALPLSEFRFDRDLAVFGLPNETLFPFEGSGIETFWRLDLPAAGNAASLSGIADVLVTFDLRSHYDPVRHAVQSAATADPVRRWILFSAQRFAADALKALNAGHADDFVFDLAALGLSDVERDRKVTNLALAFVSGQAKKIEVNVRAKNDAIDADVPCEKGIAYSNRHPDPAAPPQPAMALNALTDIRADQPFIVHVDPAKSPGVDFGDVRDLLFAIEYEAQVG